MRKLFATLLILSSIICAPAASATKLIQPIFPIQSDDVFAIAFDQEVDTQTLVSDYVDYCRYIHGTSTWVRKSDAFQSLICTLKGGNDVVLVFQARIHNGSIRVDLTNVFDTDTLPPSYSALLWASTVHDKLKQIRAVANQK